MLRAVYTARSGLQVQGLAFEAISNNIANVSTPGYKSQEARFAELLAQTLRAPGTDGNGVPSPGMQIGLGASVNVMARNFAQGALIDSGRPTDFAIQGSGFFLKSRDAAGLDRVYTRDGTFTLAADGVLRDGKGLAVLGWGADATGKVDTTAALAPLLLPIGLTASARATRSLVLQGNLDSTAATGVVVNTTLSVYDSKGGQHTIPMTLTKSATPNQWTVGLGTLTDPALSAVTVIGTTVAFTTGGALDATATTFKGIDITYNATAGVVNQTGQAGSAGITASARSLQQLATTSQIGQSSQDGATPGTLTGFTISNRGVLNGLLSNGQSQPLGIIAIASFAAPDALIDVGSNDLAASAGSGDPLVGRPATGGQGSVRAGSYESSNVDLAAEMIAMMAAERGFQVNSQTIRTADALINELVQLRR